MVQQCVQVAAHAKYPLNRMALNERVYEFYMFKDHTVFI